MIQNEVERPADIDKIERDSEYSEHVEKSNMTDSEEDKVNEEVKKTWIAKTQGS